MKLRRLKAPGIASRDALALIAQESAAVLRRLLDRSLRRGAWAKPLRLGEDKVALLFFEDVESDRLLRGDRHLRRGLRKLYHSVTEGQRVSGFGVAFLLLVKALERAGWQTVVNDRALALRNPHYPVGITGYPHILDDWDLPNPAVLAPGLLDHPQLRPRLMDDPRFRFYLQPSGWMQDLFAASYGREKCPIWFAGLDVNEWPDLRPAAKDLDLLVYDKTWRGSAAEPFVFEGALAELARRGLRFSVLRYGRYQHDEYRRLLARARGMLFLAEHETQGLACAEAMASNVPVLAWDQGLWLDPNRARFGTEPVHASSVPWFGPECGEKFQSLARLPAALDRFLARLPDYQPRRYVESHLSIELSARLYLDAYLAAGVAAKG